MEQDIERQLVLAKSQILLTVVVSEETEDVSFCSEWRIDRINLNELRSKLIAELNWYGEGGESHMNDPRRNRRILQRISSCSL